ncbi:MAG: phosphoribosylanthranilate isomerase [Acidimicrobiales bacterium]
MFVKICGVTTVDDALLAAGLGADAIGVNFVPSSKRFVEPDAARGLVRPLPPKVLSVGVFRDHPRDEVVATAVSVGLDAVQLHGHESPEDTAWVAERIPRVIKVFAATDPGLADADRFPARLMIDAPTPGGGQVFDWAVLDDAPFHRPFVLAGGLGPDNVADAIRTVRPWGVDVATGVESSPGRKDATLIRRFVTAARSVPAVRRDDFDLDDDGSIFDWEDNPA